MLLTGLHCMTHYITSHYKRFNSIDWKKKYKDIAPQKSMWGKTGWSRTIICNSLILHHDKPKPARVVKPIQITKNFATDDTANLHCYVKLDNSYKTACMTQLKEAK